jgi:hypothetical protein
MAKAKPNSSQYVREMLFLQGGRRMKKCLVVFGVISALFLMQVIPAESAPITFGGNQYDIVSFEGKSWDEAKADVVTRLGNDWHLAVITSQDIQNYVFNNLVSGSGGTEYWLGGYQNPIDEQVAANGWTWVTGASWSYTNWAGGEPNDWFGPASEQHLGMYIYNGLWYDTKNNDVSFIAGYIAEGPVPIPPSILLLAPGLLGIGVIRRRFAK